MDTLEFGLIAHRLKTWCISTNQKTTRDEYLTPPTPTGMSMYGLRIRFLGVVEARRNWIQFNLRKSLTGRCISSGKQLSWHLTSEWVFPNSAVPPASKKE